MSGERRRCSWATGHRDPHILALYCQYHDTEWGRPVHGRDALFERVSLEAFQSGLSWITILRKRPAFRAAFAGFDVDAVAAFTDSDVERLMSDASIVRNRAKIEATRSNARAIVAFEDTDLDTLLWSFAPQPRPPRPASEEHVPAVTAESSAMATELRRRGLRFVGPTTAYALMQATGMVDDHVRECWVPAARLVPVSTPNSRSDSRLRLR